MSLALLLAGCASPNLPRGEWREIRIGLCEDYPEESRSLEAAWSDLALARDHGASVLRIAFGWDAMEPERGVYDWSFWDEFVREAHGAGVTLIPYVCYTPRWAAQDAGDDFWRSPPRDPGDFGRFMGEIVRRYRGTIQSWELWNEPDNRAYWLGTAAQFAELVRAGSAAVRAADPRARVVLGGIATEVSFLESLFREHRIAPAVDVVNLHSYFETWHPEPIERLTDYVEDAAHIVQTFGEREPLWLAETGYSSVGGRAVVSEVYRARFRGEHTDEAQADALVRTLVLAAATGQLPVIAWYRINDLPPGQEVIGDDNNRHLGLRRADGRPKASLAAFAWTAKMLQQPFRMREVEVTLDGKSIGEPRVEAFDLRDGRTLVAAWLALPQSADSRPTSAEPVDDPRGARLKLRVARANGRTLRVVNTVGQTLHTGTVGKAPNGGVEFTLELRGGAPRWVVLEP